MRSVVLLGVLTSTASLLSAQVPTAQAQIAGAVMAAPPAERDSATVLGYSNYHRMAVLRQGSGDMICLADDPSDSGWHVACYHKALDPFMSRGRALRDAGKTHGEIDSIRLAEIKAGTLVMPEGPHSLFNLYAPGDSVDAATGVAKSPAGLAVVYIPYADGRTTGLPEKPGGGLPWIMFPGKPWAHIMISR